MYIYIYICIHRYVFGRGDPGRFVRFLICELAVSDGNAATAKASRGGKRMLAPGTRAAPCAPTPNLPTKIVPTKIA